MRPIDADAVKDVIAKLNENGYDISPSDLAFARNILLRMPTIDAVPVVRCKECKYYKESAVFSPIKFCFRLRGRDGKAIGYNFAEDDFCSYGERSEE